MRRTLGWLLALGFVSCGQAPDGNYRGETIFQVHGLAKLGDQTTNLSVARPRAALLWWGAPVMADPPSAPPGVCDPGDRGVVFGTGSAVSIASEVGLVSNFPVSFTGRSCAPPS